MVHVLYTLNARDHLLSLERMHLGIANNIPTVYYYYTRLLAVYTHTGTHYLSGSTRELRNSNIESMYIMPAFPCYMLSYRMHTPHHFILSVHVKSVAHISTSILWVSMNI